MTGSRPPASDRGTEAGQPEEKPGGSAGEAEAADGGPGGAGPGGGPDGEHPEHLVVGHVVKPHGIKGEVYVTSLTDRPEEVYSPDRELLLGDRRGELPASPATLVVERSRPYRRGRLVKFRELPDRTAAERYAGHYLLARTETLAPVEEDELFYHQLLDMEVVTVDGDVVGRVREVYETEPAHMLEVKAPGKVHLVPLTQRVVRKVELDRDRLVIDPPPGLLEL